MLIGLRGLIRQAGQKVSRKVPRLASYKYRYPSLMFKKLKWLSIPFKPTISVNEKSYNKYIQNCDISNGGYFHKTSELDWIKGWYSSLKHHIFAQFIAAVGDTVNVILADFPLLCILLAFLYVRTKNKNRYRVTLDVVEMLQQVDPCLIIHHLALLAHHIGNHFELYVHPIQKPAELCRPFGSHHGARELDDLGTTIDDLCDVLKIVCRNIIDPNEEVVLERIGRGHFRKVDFIVVLVPLNLFNQEVGKREEKNLLFLLVYGVNGDVFAREGVYYKDASIFLFELFSDFCLPTGRGESFPVEQVPHFLVRGESQVVDASIDCSDKVRNHLQTFNERSDEVHFFGVKNVHIPKFDVPQGLVDGPVELIAGVVMNWSEELLVFKPSFSPLFYPRN